MAKWRGTIISFIVGCGLIAAIGVWQMSFLGSDLLGMLMSWSNACFAGAVLWCGIGLLVWISAFGGFQALGYMARVFRRKVSRTEREKHPNMDSYYDYMQEQRKKSKKGPSAFLLIPGCIYLAAASLLTMAYLLLE